MTVTAEQKNRKSQEKHKKELSFENELQDVVKSSNSLRFLIMKLSSKEPFAWKQITGTKTC